jgi:predicted methyltransferase
MPVDRAEMNRKLYAALKPGGMLVIADHSAKPGDGTSVGKSLHRIEESALRREVEAAGFKARRRRRFLAPPRGCARLLDPTAERQGGRRVRA